MQAQSTKKEVVKQLQAQINAMQGLGKTADVTAQRGFAPFASAFPDKIFPTGAIHEFISYEPGEAASTSAFITALTGKFIKSGGLCLWICPQRKIFPPALKHFGLVSDRIVFIEVPNVKNALWTIEEALKCDMLTAVIGEIKEMGFTESRRLQLAVERSGVTGFIHRHRPRTENATACTARWKVSPLPSLAPDNLPGVGYSSWDIQLLKIRNGRPNSWKITWSDNEFISLETERPVIALPERHAG